MSKFKTFLLISFLSFIFSCSDKDDSSSKPSNLYNNCINYTINNETVSFLASCAVKGDGKTKGDSLNWDFGDGETSNDFEPIHTYSDTGTFQVDLKVIKESGGVINTSKKVRVKPTCKVCECSFPMDTVNSYIEFCGTSVEADDWCDADCYSNMFCSTCSNK